MRLAPKFAMSLASATMLTATTVTAHVAEGPSKTFAAADLFSLQQAGDPQVAPNGAIAYVRTSYDVMTDRGRRSIWLVDPQSGAQSPLVVDEASNLAPRW